MRVAQWSATLRSQLTEIEAANHNWRRAQILFARATADRLVAYGGDDDDDHHHQGGDHVGHICTGSGKCGCAVLLASSFLEAYRGVDALLLLVSPLCASRDAIATHLRSPMFGERADQYFLDYANAGATTACVDGEQLARQTLVLVSGGAVPALDTNGGPRVLLGTPAAVLQLLCTHEQQRDRLAATVRAVVFDEGDMGVWEPLGRRSNSTHVAPQTQRWAELRSWSRHCRVPRLYLTATLGPRAALIAPHVYMRYSYEEAVRDGAVRSATIIYLVPSRVRVRRLDGSVRTLQGAQLTTERLLPAERHQLATSLRCIRTLVAHAWRLFRRCRQVGAETLLVVVSRANAPVTWRGEHRRLDGGDKDDNNNNNNDDDDDDDNDDHGDSVGGALLEGAKFLTSVAATISSLTATRRGRSLRVCALHGGQSATQRAQCMDALAAGAFDVVLACRVAARGVNLGPRVSAVLNLAPSGSADTLTQAVLGRVVRCGASGSDRRDALVFEVEPFAHRHLYAQLAADECGGVRLCEQSAPLPAHDNELTTDAAAAAACKRRGGEQDESVGDSVDDQDDDDDDDDDNDGGGKRLRQQREPDDDDVEPLPLQQHGAEATALHFPTSGQWVATRYNVTCDGTNKQQASGFVPTVTSAPGGAAVAAVWGDCCRMSPAAVRLCPGSLQWSALVAHEH